MELIKAKEADFERLVSFYKYVIRNTENMQLYTRWIYGKYPDDDIIMDYIGQGVMYYCEKNGEIASALAVTPYQTEDYHNTEWAVSIADEEAAVVHILCVNPEMQRQGIGAETMSLVKKLARDMNKKAVRLDALSCNVPAHKLYESLGFVNRGTERWFAENVGWMDFFLFEFVL